MISPLWPHSPSFSFDPTSFVAHFLPYHLTLIPSLRSLIEPCSQAMVTLDLSPRSLLSAGLLSCLVSTAIAASLQQRKQPCPTLRVPMIQSIHGPSFNLTFGTPPQTMIMLHDWTWQSTWLYSPYCKENFSIPDCVLPGQNYFDYERSSTYRNSTDAVQTFDGTDYTPGAPFTVSFGTDNLCLPGLPGHKSLCRSKTEVEISDLAFQFPTVQDIGGIFGLAPVLPGFNATYLPAPFQFMQSGLLEYVVGWHTCQGLKNKAACDQNDFLTIMGGTETTVYRTGNMKYHNIVVTPCINAGNLKLTPGRDNYWSASWTGFWIGKSRISLQTATTEQLSTTDPTCSSIDPVAVFDEGGFGNGAPVPLSAFSTLTKITNATQIGSSAAILNQGKQGLWAVPCAAVRFLPSLVYELSGTQNITVTPVMYIDRKLQPGQCLLNARAWDRATNGAQTFFGLTVLERTYVAFDFDRLTVGLAPLNRNLYN